MADGYQRVTSTVGRVVDKGLGRPEPVLLRRYEAGEPPLPGPVLLGAAALSARDGKLGLLLADAGYDVHTTASSADTETRYGALVYDASDIADVAGLRAVYDFFHPVARSLQPCGRVLVIGAPPEDRAGTTAVAQRALEGFVRSVGKEFGRGTTANLVYAADGADVESTLRFFLSARSAYVSGQVVRVGGAAASAPDDWVRPLAGRTALVTGAARGIGEAIAETLARDGAHVVCLDVPAAGEALSAVANRVAGTSLQCDITTAHAPTAIAKHLADRHGGVDVVVHNAGITRDKTLAKMSEQQWNDVLGINLGAPHRITEALLADGVLRPHGRVIAVSSVSGIAGNFGQTNYATSKAGVIGLVDGLATALRTHHATCNAVAPGFIETRLTARMPLLIREMGRRMNSLSQGGRPVDVAETIAWLAGPGSGGVTGNVVRVCGQSMLGA